MPYPNATRSQSKIEIQAILQRLMNHYWTPDDTEPMREAIMADLLEDMIEFDAEIVRNACAEWRRTQNERPKPMQLRAAGIAEITRRSEKNRSHASAKQPNAHTDPRLLAMRDADRAARRKLDDDARLAREQIATEYGYPSFGYMLSIGLVHAVNARQNGAAGGRRNPTAADLGVTATENGHPITKAAE